MDRICITPACLKPILAKGMCTTCYARTSYRANREHKLQVKRDWVANNKDKVKLLKRNNSLLRLYGVTPEVYNQLLEKQDGKCAVCDSSHSKRAKMPGLVVDHNHETGQIRGLLCSPCNVAIGMLQDSPILFKKVLEYLTK